MVDGGIVGAESGTVAEIYRFNVTAITKPSTEQKP
jgi:hypothetical protein